MYTITGGARQDKRTALDAFDSLAEQERYQNNASEQIEEAQEVQKKNALGTVGGMVAAEGVKGAIAAEGAGATASTAAAGVGAGTGAGAAGGATAAGASAASGATASTATVSTAGAGGASGAASTLAAIPGWGWMALGGLALLSAGGVFD